MINVNITIENNANAISNLKAKLQLELDLKVNGTPVELPTFNDGIEIVEQTPFQDAIDDALAIGLSYKQAIKYAKKVTGIK